MSELPPDLPRLRTLETWLQLTLDQVRQHIAIAEQRAAQQQRAIPPPPPDWVVQLSRAGVDEPEAIIDDPAWVEWRGGRPHDYGLRE